MCADGGDDDDAERPEGAEEQPASNSDVAISVHATMPA
jgi:hypothetical protein